MSKAKLGQGITTDVGRLIETRMLIQANSGGGKSYAIRKLLEETHGAVQQIVLDMEGEFGTLRERFDYVLAGKGGDVDAHPQTAELLARKVLELEVSLIVDLYELKKPERIRFVKNFVDALVNSPKENWHPVLVVIDEAHVFVPEKGDSEAASAVIDLATRGRKRGFAAVLATQRLSKLDKDVAAECLNKLIGRTSLDIDRKRASDELGFVSAEDNRSLRNLKPGDFYAFGPAISDEVVLGKIGQVATTHPKAGQRLGFKRTRPTDHIKSVLKKLDDLPKEAQAELTDKAALRARVKELEAELRKKPKETVKAVPTLSAAEKKEIFKKAVREAKHDLDRYLDGWKGNGVTISGPDRPFIVFGGDGSGGSPHAFARRPLTAGEKIKEHTAVVEREGKAYAAEKPLSACARKILGFLYSYQGRSFNKVQVGTMAGYRHTSSTFANALSELATKDFILREAGGRLRLNPVAIEEIQEKNLGESPLTLQDWIAKLGACERALYQKMLANPDTVFIKEALGEETGYRHTSSTFANALSKLSTLGLIKREHGGVTLNPEIQNL